MPDFESGNETSSCLSKRISVSEIYDARQMSKCSQKSLDPDGLHPLMWRHCGDKVVCLLYAMFNAVLDSGKWPWTLAKVIMLRKQGKLRYDTPGSFRPITLTSYVGKLMETILNNRLKNSVKHRDLLPDSQHGFRKSRSTATYLLELITTVQDRKL